MAVDSMTGEPMKDKTAFWKGVSAGFLAGMAVAAALRFTVFERFLTNFATVDAKLERDRQRTPERNLELPAERPEAPTSLPAASAPIAIRRAQPDTADWAAARTGAVASFLRTGGGSATEVMEGSGERVDHIDLSQPLQKQLRPYPRSLDLGSAG